MADKSFPKRIRTLTQTKPKIHWLDFDDFVDKDNDIESDFVTQLTIPDKLRTLNQDIEWLTVREWSGVHSQLLSWFFIFCEWHWPVNACKCRSRSVVLLFRGHGHFSAHKGNLLTLHPLCMLHQVTLNSYIALLSNSFFLFYSSKLGTEN